jgi:hypothetical protein
MSILVFLTCLFVQTPFTLAQSDANPAEVLQKVEQAVNSAFGAVDPVRRKSYADKIGAVALASIGSPRMAEILEALPTAALYHATHVTTSLQQASRLGIPTGDLEQEGYDIEADFLSFRVTRALSVHPTESSLSVLDAQVNQIFETATSEMKQHYQGEGMERLLTRFTQEKAVWRFGETSPFNSSLDTPLSESDLHLVLNGIRGAIRASPSTTVNAEDLRDPDKLKALGVVDAIQRALRAAGKATEICFRDFEPYEKRAEAWTAKVEERVRAASEKRAAAGSAALKGPFTGGPVPDSRLKGPSGAPHAPGGNVDAAPDRPRSETSMPPAESVGVVRILVILLLVISAGGLVWFSVRRRLG